MGLLGRRSDQEKEEEENPARIPAEQEKAVASHDPTANTPSVPPNSRFGTWKAFTFGASVDDALANEPDDNPWAS